MKFINKLTAGLGIFALLAVVALPALAATEGAVSATVTAQLVSIASIDDGTVVYGILNVNTSKDTTASGLNDSQTATNDGNVSADFNIKGSDSANWTLAGAAGADQYKHEFCRGDTGDCDGTPAFTALTTDYQTLDTAVGANGTQVFDLKITTPTSSSNFTEQSVNVTVQVVAS